MKRRKHLVKKAITGDESLDLLARKVIMASLAYYGLNISLMTDNEYDKCSLAIFKRWKRLDKPRQWQLGDRQSIRATGYQIRVTQAAVGGTIAWAKALGHQIGQIQLDSPWKWSKKQKLHYLYPSNFSLPIKTKKKRKRLRRRLSND